MNFVIKSWIIITLTIGWKQIMNSRQHSEPIEFEELSRQLRQWSRGKEGNTRFMWMSRENCTFDLRTHQKVTDKGLQQSKIFCWNCFKIGVGTWLASNSQGKSKWSDTVMFDTCPERPGKYFNQTTACVYNFVSCDKLTTNVWHELFRVNLI